MSLSEKMHEPIVQAITQANLPQNFYTQIEQFFVPLADYVHRLTTTQSEPLVLSLQGPQGSGKSTLCAFLQLLLEQQYNHKLAVLSLDDFYLTMNERQSLADKIHPLLATRGVPGTHNLSLAVDTISALKVHNKPYLPRFNKAIDNPYPTTEWPRAQDNTSIILFEGWCNHVPPQEVEALKSPINELESKEDPEGIWRSYVNEQLKRYHEQLFGLSDALLYLEIPDFNLVYQWRGLQEEKLRQSSNTSSQIMNDHQLHRFIQHFERLTRQAMTTLPGLADAVMSINETHEYVGFNIKQQVV